MLVCFINFENYISAAVPKKEIVNDVLPVCGAEQNSSISANSNSQPPPLVILIPGASLATPSTSSNQSVPEVENVGEDLLADQPGQMPKHCEVPDVPEPTPGPSRGHGTDQNVGPLAGADSETVNLLLHKIKVIQKEKAKDKRDLKESRATVQLLREKCKSLVSDKNNFRQKLNRSENKLRGMMNRPISEKEKAYIVNEKLSPYLAPAQINAFLRKWKRVPYNEWDDEDIELALTLRSIDKRFYNILRSKHLLPLPADSTLRKYFKHFQVAEGYLESVDPLLKMKARDLSLEERLVTLSFDEVHLRADISYSKAKDQFVGLSFELCLLLLKQKYLNITLCCKGSRICKVSISQLKNCNKFYPKNRALS